MSNALADANTLPAWARATFASSLKRIFISISRLLSLPPSNNEEKKRSASLKTGKNQVVALSHTQRKREGERDRQEQNRYTKQIRARHICMSNQQPNNPRSRTPPSCPVTVPSPGAPSVTAQIAEAAAAEAATAAGLSKPKSQRRASQATHHFACPQGASQRVRETKREREREPERAQMGK